MDNNVNYVPQVDYTSRDYSAIREDLLNLIPNYAPEWTNREPSDLGMTLVELFAYMGDMLNFYIDRAANEGFLATASQRDSILQIADMLGYSPTTSAAAKVTLTFTNITDTAIVVPAKTQIATSTIVDGTSTQIVFETDEAVTVPATTETVVDDVTTRTIGTANVGATQGTTVEDEELGVSTGAPSQMFKLVDSPVIFGTVDILVNSIRYVYSSSLIENSIYDPVFTTLNDSTGETYVVFGDGIGGRVPPVSGTITATYRVGNGADGNVQSGTLTEFLTNGEAGLTVTNQSAAVGGADEESTDSIRVNAPLALRTLRRAVSLKDYGYLALQVSGVNKAIAESSSFNSVTLYIAPFGNTGLVDGVASAAFNALADTVTAYFTDKVAPNMTLTILPPTYVPVDSDITVHVLPQYRQDVVLPQAELAVKELVALDNSFFADRIPTQFILNAISAVPGVEYSTIEYLRRQDDLQSYSVTAWSRASNIMTITIGAGHSITVGQTIKVVSSAGNSNAEIEGTHVVLAIASTTVSFGTTTSGTASGTPTGATARAMVIETIECAVNEIPSAGTLNITATGGIA